MLLSNSGQFVTAFIAGLKEVNKYKRILTSFKLLRKQK